MCDRSRNKGSHTCTPPARFFFANISEAQAFMLSAVDLSALPVCLRSSFPPSVKQTQRPVALYDGLSAAERDTDSSVIWSQWFYKVRTPCGRLGAMHHCPEGDIQRHPRHSKKKKKQAESSLSVERNTTRHVKWLILSQEPLKCLKILHFFKLWVYERLCQGSRKALHLAKHMTPTLTNYFTLQTN